MLRAVSKAVLPVGEIFGKPLEHEDYTNSHSGVGQRYINITRNEIGPKSGQKDCRKF